MCSIYDPEAKIWHGAKIPYPFEKDFMVGDLVYPNLCSDPKKILQICEADDSEMTCEDLRINSIRIVQNMRKIGIKEDDVVCLFLDSTNFTTYVINACVFMGAILNPLHAGYDENDIMNLLKEIQPKLIICEDDNVQKIARILTQSELEIPMYSTSNENSHFPSALDFLKPTNEENGFKLQKFSKPAHEKLLVILCSSGTTGKPKGACISHSSVLEWIPMIRGGRETVSTCYSPICWGSGFFRNVSAGMALTDKKIVISRKFDVDHFIEIVDKFKVTNITIPPRQLAILLNSEKFVSLNLESLNTFISVGSILSTNLRKMFEKLFPKKTLMVAYSMSEGSVAMTLPNEYKKEFSVGSMIFPNTLVKIVDEDGNNLENGQHGEICIKPIVKFLGYYNNLEATFKIYDRDGFIKSGDIGYFDESGMLYVLDRKKDILKCQGYQLNPSDIENVIESIKGVQHVAVVGVPDEIFTNLLTAAVVKCKGYDHLTEKQIVEYVARELPHYKQLHGGVYFFDELPMTASDKVQKRLVLEAILKEEAKFIAKSQ